MKSLDEHHVALKAFIAFLIVSLAAVVFFFYNEKSYSVYQDGNLKAFTILSILGVLLLLGLLYLVSQPHHGAKASKSSKKKKR